MPAIIIGGRLNINTPQQNAGCFVGSYNLGGWDANQKQSQAMASTLGSFNVIVRQTNVAWDNVQQIDGAINDQDMKAQVSGNV